MNATEITQIPNQMRTKCEVFSRVVGYYRPTINWNRGKMEEFKDRNEFDEKTCMCSPFATAGKPTIDAVKK